MKFVKHELETARPRAVGIGCGMRSTGARTPRLHQPIRRSYCFGSLIRARQRRAGFTLLEVLLTIGIIALIATALIGGSARLLTQQAQSVDDIFWKTVQEARKTALKLEHEVRLKFDKEKKQFVLIDGLAPTQLNADGITRDEVPLKVFPIPPEASSDLVVDFLGPASSGGPMLLVGGMLLEANPVTYVTFYSDGTCTSFRLQISRHGAVHTLTIDPWTCAAVLKAGEQGNG